MRTALGTRACEGAATGLTRQRELGEQGRGTARADCARRRFFGKGIRSSRLKPSGGFDDLDGQWNGLDWFGEHDVLLMLEVKPVYTPGAVVDLIDGGVLARQRNVSMQDAEVFPGEMFLRLAGIVRVREGGADRHDCEQRAETELDRPPHLFV